MMFGVSLSLRAADFKRVLVSPRAAFRRAVRAVRAASGATCLATWALRIDPPLALGMILVAACPGGAFSNIMTWLARGNVPSR